jgi:hypothetical protein
MINKELNFITEEQYKNLIDLGFNWYSCRCGGFPDCICETTGMKPTSSLVLKWLREKKNTFVFVVPNYKMTWERVLHSSEDKLHIPKAHVFSIPMQDDKTYEESELYGIEQAIQMLKHKK